MDNPVAPPVHFFHPWRGIISEHGFPDVHLTDGFEARLAFTFFASLILALFRVCDATADALIESGDASFTVADSIEMTRIVDPDTSRSNVIAPQFKFSPDRRHFIVVTQKGNLRTGYSEYELLVFDVDQVRAHLKRKEMDRASLSSAVAFFQTKARFGGISDARWLADNESVAFVGRGPDGIGQVYSVNTRTRVLKQLTHHPSDVAAFDVALEPSIVVYSAFEAPDWTARNREGYVVESEYVKHLSLASSEDAIAEVKYFLCRLGSATYQEIELDPSVIPRNIWISPSGRWAIALVQPKSIPARWWEEYEALASMKRQEIVKGEPTVQEALGDAVFGRQPAWLNQFVLIDVESAQARPVFNAPSGSALAGLVLSAVWSTDSERVVIANTFLPLDESNVQERERRQRSPSIIELSLASGYFVRIADVLLFGPHSVHQLLEFEGSGNELRMGWSSGRGIVDVRRVFNRQNQRWVEIKKKERGSAGELTFEINQSMNSPPEIAVIGPGMTTAEHISDLNPRLRSLTLGRGDPFEWSTPDGRNWVGGLILPPNFQSKVRYPVVIQTYGFNPMEFLVDGPDGKTAAFAARAIANRGIVVLQMPRDPVGFGGPSENSNQLTLLEAAIDALDKKALIDRDRIGLIGFSRTGMHVHHAITFSKPGYEIAAATICDSITDGYLSYVNHYGSSYPGVLSWERLIGAAFWGEGRKLWLERSAAFNLHRIKTPLRIEHLGAYPSDLWDTFSLLKRHGRPVEMIHLPEGTHQLTQPLARLASEQGNVDWFDFWLNGYEDPQPSKSAQYARWRILREQRNAVRGKGLEASSLCPDTQWKFSPRTPCNEVSFAGR